MHLKPWAKIFLIVLILGIIFFIFKDKMFNKTKPDVPKSILEQYNIPEEKYSKTLEFVLNNEIYQEAYLDEYAQIKYSDKANFKDILTTFLAKGYKGTEINYIMALSDNNIAKLKQKDYVDLKNYYSFKNFNVDNIERYNSYYENNNYSYENVVTYVNIKMDLPVYTDTLEVSDPDDYLVLVNKYSYLPTNYKPTDLVYMKGYYGDEVPLRSIAKEALVKLQTAVKEEKGIELLPTTAFRTHSHQATLYNNYVAKNGKTKADTFSARPGYSEHQTGLAIDLKNPIRPQGERLNDDDYDWLKNNAHRFGFIVRYPGGKEFITGYQEEDWHIRYVGIEAATTIYENKLTLEEYLDLYTMQY